MRLTVYDNITFESALFGQLLPVAFGKASSYGATADGLFLARSSFESLLSYFIMTIINDCEHSCLRPQINGGCRSITPIDLQ